MPEGFVYTVTEVQEDGYQTSVSVNNGDAEKTLLKSISLNENLILNYINYRPPVAPTDVRFLAVPSVWLLLAGILLLFFALSGGRKRNKS